MPTSTQHPLVSVIIPTFNRAGLLVEAIQSVLNQTYAPIEIVVVDDASTEDISAAIAQFASRITCIRRDTNGGRSAALNDGAATVSGEFIAILDSDDVWLPHKLEAQMALFERFPECGAVAGGAQLMDLSGKPFGKLRLPQEVIQYERLAISMCLPGSNSNELIRRSAFDQIGGFDPDLRRAQDYDFWLKFTRQYPIRAVPEVLMYKRAHNSPRPDAGMETIIQCRKVIASRIPEANLRRRHLAWMWFQMATRAFNARRYGTGIGYLGKSFANYPLSIAPAHSRLKGLVWLIQDMISRH